jgi:hypothetical protein
LCAECGLEARSSRKSVRVTHVRGKVDRFGSLQVVT